jgi:tetratricopeptide (TPR) repeat protein
VCYGRGWCAWPLASKRRRRRSRSNSTARCEAGLGFGASCASIRRNRRNSVLTAAVLLGWPRVRGGKISERGTATGNVFISYRREDSAAYAGRLFDHLKSLIGDERVFMDVEDIAPGQPFAHTIDETIARCDVALIIIGPKWPEILHQRSQDGQRDYVCHEIEAALGREITTVPVLVGGATMAQLSGLPGKLSVLAQYEAAELRDSSFSDDCARLAKSLRLEAVAASDGGGQSGRRRARIALLGIVLLAGLFLVAAAGLGPWREYRARRTSVAQMLATGKTQAERGEYEPAFHSYQELLKVDPTNRIAQDRQVDAAMGWVEDFHVIAPEGGSSEKLAATQLDEITPVLDAGLARANGQVPRAADILAHLGWAHWLNQKLAQREFGESAERDLRAALKLDPSNVFAHAMMGNWLMQTGGSTEEALAHFRTAVDRNQARPLVRRMQLGVLIYPRDPESRVALIRVANDMRRSGESLTDGERSRVLTSYSPTVNSAEELWATLSAVPPDDAWATYLWLVSGRTYGGDADFQRLQNDFIHAIVLEQQHDRDGALAAFEKLRAELKKRGYNGRIVTHVEGAVTRLSTR